MFVILLVGALVGGILIGKEVQRPVDRGCTAVHVENGCK